jgi:Spy/CpxP family protein refolding chaperone
LIAILLLSLAGLGFAQAPAASPHEGKSHMDMMGMGMRGMPTDQEIDRSVGVLQRTLNLSSTQVNTIRDLARVRRDDMRAMREEAAPKWHQLMSLLNQPNPDPTAVGRATIELKAVHDRFRAKRADMEKQLSSVLNPTQRQTVDQLRSQAPTFMALRRLGLIQPDFQEGMSNRMRTPDTETGRREY